MPPAATSCHRSPAVQPLIPNPCPPLLPTHTLNTHATCCNSQPRPSAPVLRDQASAPKHPAHRCKKQRQVRDAKMLCTTPVGHTALDGWHTCSMSSCKACNACASVRTVRGVGNPVPLLSGTCWDQPCYPRLLRGTCFSSERYQGFLHCPQIPYTCPDSEGCCCTPPVLPANTHALTERAAAAPRLYCPLTHMP